MSFRRGRSTEGAGLPATAFRVVGDRHYDSTAKLDYVLRLVSGTLTWVRTTPEIPTISSLGAAKSTIGAGLPGFSGRLNGDLHYNETDKKEYVLTGSPGPSATDTFSRTGDLGGTTTETGGLSWVTYDNGTGAINNAVWVTNGSQAVKAASASNNSSALLDVGAGDIDFTITLTKGNNDVSIAIHETAYDSNVGYRIRMRENFTELYNGATYLGDFGANAVGSTRKYRIVRQGTVVHYYRDDVLLTSATAAASSGTRVRIADAASSGPMPAFDDLSVKNLGTLAWTSTDEHVASHAHGDLASADHTHPTTRYAVSTLGAGLPTFSGRVNGDLHYNTTDKKEYVHTGSSAGEYQDTYTRADATGVAAIGPTEVGGGTYSGVNGDPSSIVSNRLRLTVGGGGGTSGVSLPGFTGNADLSVLVTMGNPGSEVAVKATAGTRGTGYRILGNKTQPNSGAAHLDWTVYKDGTSLATGRIAHGADDPRVWRIVAVDGQVEFYIGGLLLHAFTDATPLTTSGIHLLSFQNTIAEFDDLKYTALGTLKWQSTDEFVAPHTHTNITASATAFTPTGTLAATNVQDAIAELTAESQRSGVAQPTVTSVVVSDGGTAHWKVISDTTGILITRAAPVASPSVFWLTSPDGTRWRLGATTAGAVTTTSGTPAADDAVFSTKNPLLLPTNDPTYVFALTVTDAGGLVTTEA